MNVNLLPYFHNEFTLFHHSNIENLKKITRMGRKSNRTCTPDQACCDITPPFRQATSLATPSKISTAICFHGPWYISICRVPCILEENGSGIFCKHEK